MEVGKFLSKIVGEKNIQMLDIARLTGVSPAFLSDLKKGKKSCKEETWKEIIKYLRLTKEEESQAWRAWSEDRMDKKTKEYLKKLEEENENLKKILDAIEFVKTNKDIKK